MDEIIKCEECPFYDQCKAIDNHHFCPMAENFDNMMNEITKAENIEDLRDRVHIVVKNVIKAYEKQED